MAATRADAVGDDAEEHEGHADEDHEVRSQLWPGHRSVVVIQGRVQVCEEVGPETQDHDRESDQRCDREAMGRRHPSHPTCGRRWRGR